MASVPFGFSIKGMARLAVERCKGGVMSVHFRPSEDGVACVSI